MSAPQVRIRMYNTGFGDCFLLTFPAPDRPRKVLIDCGKHMLSKSGPKISRIVEQLLQDITEAGGARVDVLIATHRHQDHVSGFAAKEWKNVTVGEVWMPWTEDPTDTLAREICERQSSRAARLHLAIQSAGLAADDADYLLGYAGNNLTNASAMKLLHDGFQGQPIRRFLPIKSEEMNHFSPKQLPGVDVFVLGPPRDPDVLAEMDPPGTESFLRAAEMAGKKPENADCPFDDRWCLNRKEFTKRYMNCEDEKALDEDFPPAWESRIGQIFDEPAMELAAKLEQAVNSTSLILLFHVGDAWLLFPGDAQWGSWNSIMQDPVRARLLENLTFYKVGHHGSHNATPRSFVERYLNQKVVAMMPYGKVEKWPTIPRQALLDRLTEKKVLLARSDTQPNDSTFNWKVEDGGMLYIDASIPI